MQLTMSSNTDLQQQAVQALGLFVSNHHDNQSAAVAAGVASHLMQLTKSNDVALQHEALAPCSRARIEGLQGRSETNGQAGVFCGELEQASMMYQT
jgi:hypothetical protein